MARVATTIGVITDAFGDLWDAREIRHDGPQIALGWPKGWPRGRGGVGGARLIPTRSLVEYMERHVADRGAVTRMASELPISRTAIIRLRGVLGLDYYEACREWWQDRVADLSDLTLDEFAARHHVTVGAAERWRLKLIGKKLRPAGWWKEGETADMLRSDLPTAYLADVLDIGVGSIRRLRWLLAHG